MQSEQFAEPREAATEEACSRSGSDSEQERESQASRDSRFTRQDTFTRTTRSSLAGEHISITLDPGASQVGCLQPGGGLLLL